MQMMNDFIQRKKKEELLTQNSQADKKDKDQLRTETRGRSDEKSSSQIQMRKLQHKDKDKNDYALENRPLTQPVSRLKYSQFSEGNGLNGTQNDNDDKHSSKH